MFKLTAPLLATVAAASCSEPDDGPQRRPETVCELHGVGLEVAERDRIHPRDTVRTPLVVELKEMRAERWPNALEQVVCSQVEHDGECCPVRVRVAYCQPCEEALHFYLLSGPLNCDLYGD